MKPYILNTEKRNSVIIKFNLSENKLKDTFDFKTIKRKRKQQKCLLKLENKKARKQLKQQLNNYEKYNKS